MSIALLVMTDGRADCLTRTLARFDEMVTGPITRRIIHDDSGDMAHQRWLASTYPTYELVTTPGRSGFDGAIRSAWRCVASGTDRWVFHLEDDFLFQHPIDLADLVAVLVDRPYLAQMALRRQAWNAAEQAAGGVVELHPDAYRERRQNGAAWLEHRLFLTTNPSLYRRSLCTLGWPSGHQSEGRFTAQLLEQGLPWGVAGAAVRFGYWGARDSGVWVEHIGHDRVGTGY